jgi:hypothetical protein
MKLIKNANGKTTVKISHQEWVQIGKEAGFWDNVQQVGKGVKGIGQGAWNAGAGIVGILGNAYKGLSNGIQQLRARIQQGQVSRQEYGQYKQMIEGMQNDLAAADAELAAIDQQTAQSNQQADQADADYAAAQPSYASEKPIKLIKKANGKTTIKLTEQEWLDMGKKAGFPEAGLEVDDERFDYYVPGFDTIFRGVQRNDIEMVQRGIDAGAKPNRMILEQAVLGPMGIKPNKEIITLLLEAGAVPTDGTLSKAERQKDPEMIELIKSFMYEPRNYNIASTTASTKPIRLIKKANGKTTIKINENKWQQIGLANGWIKIKTVKTANIIQHNPRHKEYPYNLLWNLDYEQDPSEPDIAVEFNYKWDAGSDGAFTQGIAGVEQGRRTESDREPAFDITALKVTAQENTVYGPAGTDITESMETGPIIEIIEDALYEEKRNEELGY